MRTRGRRSAPSWVTVQRPTSRAPPCGNEYLARTRSCACFLEDTMPVEQTTEYLRVRRAYEVGRLRTALPRAALVVVPVALVASLVTGRAAIVWLPVTLVTWIVLHW